MSEVNDQLLMSFLTAKTPSLQNEMRPLLEEVFLITPEEIRSMILKINNKDFPPGQRLFIGGHLDGEAHKIPEEFFENLKTKDLESSLKGLSCSLRITNSHLLHDRAKAFVQRFFQKHQIPISMNMYITPSQEAPCFKFHCDFADMFIYQILGSKEWVFCQEESGDFHFGESWESNSNVERLNKYAQKKMLLHQGEILHLPHLIFHKADCLDAPSIHLTISLNWPRTEHLFKIFENLILDKIRVPPGKNFSDQQIENLSQEIAEFLSTQEFKDGLKHKCEEQLFLAKSKIVRQGR